jgi:hypothetical protein
MKIILALALILVALQGCTKQDTTTTPATTTNQVSGAWKVTSLIDNKGRDLTSRYSTYSFDFATSGALQVKQGTTVVKTGTWSNTSSYWTAAIVISITGVLPEDDLANLNEDWRIMEKNDTVIKVQNGGGKVLSFGK